MEMGNAVTNDREELAKAIESKTIKVCDAFTVYTLNDDAKAILVSALRAEVDAPIISNPGDLEMRANKYTCMGMTIQFDGRLPEGTIEVRDRVTERVLCKIVNLAPL